MQANCPQVRSGAQQFCPPVGMAQLYLKPLPRARARAVEKLSVPFNLGTDWRGPSKTSWSRNLELRWSPEVRCWPGWLSVVPIFSCPLTIVSHTMATHPTCDKRWRVEMPSYGECVDYRRRNRHKLESRWSRGVFVGVRVKNDRAHSHGRDWDKRRSIRETSAQIAAERAWNALGAEPRRSFGRFP